MAPSNPQTTLSLGEQISEFVDRELVKLCGVLDDVQDLPLSGLVEMRLNMADCRGEKRGQVQRARMNLTS